MDGATPGPTVLAEEGVGRQVDQGASEGKVPEEDPEGREAAVVLSH